MKRKRKPKTYNSVDSMVKDLSSPKFYKAYKKEQRKVKRVRKVKKREKEHKPDCDCLECREYGDHYGAGYNGDCV